MFLTHKTEGKKMLFVSIIIPTRNEEKFIRKCLESLTTQNFPRNQYEILVIDGESEDRTIEIASEFSVKIIQNQKRKLAPAYNLGIKNATGEIVAFIDANAYADQDWLSLMIEDFDDSQVGCVIGGQECIFLGKSVISKIRMAYHTRSNLLHSKKLIREPHPITWKNATTFAAAFRKNVLIDIGGFDESLDSVDREFAVLIEKLNYKIIKDRRAKAYHQLESALIPHLKKTEKYSKVGGILFRRYGIYKKSALMSVVVLGYIITIISLLLGNIILNLSFFYLFIALLPLLGGLIYYFGKGIELNLLNKENLTAYIAFPFLSLLFIFLKGIGFTRGVLNTNIQGNYPFRTVPFTIDSYYRK